jgi:hypothetical protein
VCAFNPYDLDVTNPYNLMPPAHTTEQTLNFRDASVWPALEDAEKKAIQDLLDAANKSTGDEKTAKRKEALEKLKEILKGYGYIFPPGVGPWYKPNLDDSGGFNRAMGVAWVGGQPFASVATLYSSVAHEMVHYQQWADPLRAVQGNDAREAQAYDLELRNARRTGLSSTDQAWIRFHRDYFLKRLGMKPCPYY